MKHSDFNENQNRRPWHLILFLAIVCFAVSGCAEFLEDYQYNPAGPLYTSNSGY